MFYLTKDTLPFFLPLGFVGVYRWFWFFIRILAYCLYKPIKPRRHPRYKPYRDVTILVPTIDSGEEIKAALRSWLRNNPFEVIFITIPSAKQALEDLANEIDPQRRVVRVITVQKPNKRNQMVAGVNHVKSDIVVFCDDDAIWPDTMLAWILAPFEDRQMGGVGTSQTVVTKNKHMTIWEILAAYRISMRNIEITSSTYIDGGVCCLSGRTAAYRTAILRDPKFQWDFTHEFWLGRFHQHSGDDKFLTRWMHSHAWKTYIQCCPQAELASTFKDNWRFLKQLLRWTRNTWRSDIRSLIFERQVWTRHPFVAFSMLDKFFNPVTLLAGPVTVAYLATRHQNALPVWAVLTSYIAWLLITRLIKYMPHFVRRPQDALAIPIWLIFNIVFVIMKIYCLFTLHVTDWGTRQGADDKHDGDNDISEIYVPHWLEDVPDATLARNSSGADEKGAVTETRPALQDAAQHAQQDRPPEQPQPQSQPQHYPAQRPQLSQQWQPHPQQQWSQQPQPWNQQQQQWQPMPPPQQRIMTPGEARQWSAGSDDTILPASPTGQTPMPGYPAGYAAYVPYEQYALQYAITPYPPQPDPVVIQIPQRVQPAPEARNAPVPAAPLRDTFSSISTIEPAYGGAPRGFVSSDDSFAPFAAQPHAHPQARR